MTALKKAMLIRDTRAIFRRELKAGRCLADDYILDPPEWLKSMKLIDLLLIVPQVGPVAANKILESAHISYVKTVGGLTERQRKEIVNRLRG